MHSNRDLEAMHERETHPPGPDTQEALSKRYSDAAVVLVRLRSGRFAVYNAIKEFCGVVDELTKWPPLCWRPPEALPERKSVDLKELGLL